MNQRVMLLALVAAAAAACTPSENVGPSPEDRALCEARCFSERGTCRASDYICERAESACKRGCRRFD